MMPQSINIQYLNKNLHFALLPVAPHTHTPPCPYSSPHSHRCRLPTGVKLHSLRSAWLVVVGWVGLEWILFSCCSLYKYPQGAKETHELLVSSAIS